METIAISKFKATCLAVLEKVRKTGQPVMVTRFGHPVAEIAPPGSGLKPVRQLGTMIGTMKITGDIVGPIGDDLIGKQPRNEASFGHAHLDLGRARVMEAFLGSCQSPHSAGQCAISLAAQYLGTVHVDGAK